MRALEAMGLGGRNARVIVPTLGGGFGTGLDTHAYEYIAILLAHRTGRPVKILYDRERGVRLPLAAPVREDPHRAGLRRRAGGSPSAASRCCRTTAPTPRGARPTRP